MAELFTVIFDQGEAGGATAGFQAENQTEFKTFGAVPEIARIVTISAGTAQEAITGVKKAYGGPTTQSYKVAKTSNVETKAP